MVIHDSWYYAVETLRHFFVCMILLIHVKFHLEIVAMVTLVTSSADMANDTFQKYTFWQM